MQSSTQGFMVIDKNAKPSFSIKPCKQGWLTLKKIENEPATRYCDICDKSVHLCTTEAQLHEAVKYNWCVASTLFTCTNEKSVNSDKRQGDGPHQLSVGVARANYEVTPARGAEGQTLDDVDL